MFSDLGRRENNTFIDKVNAQSSLPELFDLPVSSYTTYNTTLDSLYMTGEVLLVYRFYVYIRHVVLREFT